MPNVCNDDREYMSQVENYMEDRTKDRRTPSHPGEVGFFRAWLFSHFDSRGGSFLAEAPNAIKAIEQFIDEIFHGGEEEEHTDFEINTAFEDLQGFFEVLVLGRQVPPNGELLAGFAEEDGHYSYRLQMRFICGPEVLVEWHDLDTIVLWSNFDEVFDREANINLPEIGSNTTEYRLVPWELGEDAVGLWRLK